MITSPPESMSDGMVFQNSFYIGLNVQNVLYGIGLLLYLKTIRILLTHGRASKANIFYAFFSSIMMLLITLWLVTTVIFCDNMWLSNPQYPGGPDAYWKENGSVWYMAWGTTAAIVLQLMTDALMIYRCQIIWNNYWVTIVPITLWLAALALGFLVDWAASTPGGDFFTGVASQLGFAYFTVSVFLSATLTCSICYRLVQHGKAVQEYLGIEYASFYFSVASVIVESMLPSTLSGIAFLVSFGMDSSTSVAFLCVHVSMICISPQLLILRVIAGRSWEKDTVGLPASTVKFSAGDVLASHGIDTTRVSVHLQTLSNVYSPNAHRTI